MTAGFSIVHSMAGINTTQDKNQNLELTAEYSDSEESDISLSEENFDDAKQPLFKQLNNLRDQNVSEKHQQHPKFSDNVDRTSNAYLLSCLFCFLMTGAQALSMVAAQLLDGIVPMFQLNMGGFGFALASVIPFILYRKPDFRVPPKAIPLLILLSLTLYLQNITFFAATLYIPVGTNHSLNKFTSITVTLIIAHVRWRMQGVVKLVDLMLDIIAAVVMIIGILMVIQPQFIFAHNEPLNVNITSYCNPDRLTHSGSDCKIVIQRNSSETKSSNNSISDATAGSQIPDTRLMNVTEERIHDLHDNRIHHNKSSLHIKTPLENINVSTENPLISHTISAKVQMLKSIQMRTNDQNPKNACGDKSRPAWIGYIIGVLSGLLAVSKVFLVPAILRHMDVIHIMLIVPVMDFILSTTTAVSVEKFTGVSGPMCVILLICNFIGAAGAHVGFFAVMVHMPTTDYTIVSCLALVMLLIFQFTLLTSYVPTRTDPIALLGAVLISVIALGKPVIHRWISSKAKAKTYTKSGLCSLFKKQNTIL